MLTRVRADLDTDRVKGWLVLVASVGSAGMTHLKELRKSNGPGVPVTAVSTAFAAFVA